MKNPSLPNPAAENPGNTALLVIDVQWGLFQHSTPIYQADQLLNNIQALVDCSHQKGVAVFYIQHAGQSTLVEGSQDWKLHPRICPIEGDHLIHKRHGSAFQETPLKDEFQSRNITNLVISGLVTHGCVKATCLDAKRQGYNVILVKDAHSNFSKQAKTLIDEWNRKLEKEGIILEPTTAIHFD